MPKGISYGQLMNRHLRSLIADVLAQVAREGLPGEHHFFITFDTSHPGVDMSESLRTRYPETMTIVMQEWYDDLAVSKDRFTITLNFGDVREPLVIPFAAITTFVDPSAEFGLRFDAQEEADAQAEQPKRAPAPPTPIKPQPEGAVVSLDKFRKT